MSSTLTPLQEQVLESIAAGETATAAAATAGVHRNTVGNWMRCSSLFRQALSRAHHGQRLCWREQAESRAAAAFAAIDQILADPQVPAAVRSRVALAIIAMASTTIEAPYDESWGAAHAMRQFPAEPQPALPAPAATAPAPAPPAEIVQPEKAQKVPNFAQAAASQPQPPATAASPKIGRNDPCPCGSGKKFKRCCLLLAPPPHQNGFDASKLRAIGA